MNSDEMAKLLNDSPELLTDDERIQTDREKEFEFGLPEYLQHDLDAYKDGLNTDSSFMDCLWCELYGSINIAEISDGSITPEHANYLRRKYLYGSKT